MQQIAQLFQSLILRGGTVWLSLACAVLAALIYAYRGKPWIGGAILGFFLGPFGLFVAFLTAGRSSGPVRTYTPSPTATPPQLAPRRTYEMPGRCPHCNGPVHQHRSEQAWTTCFYCGAHIEGRIVR